MSTSGLGLGPSPAAPAGAAGNNGWRSPSARWPMPSPSTVLLSGPRLMLRGPKLMLKGSGMVLRAPGRTRRFISSAAARRRQQLPPKEGDQVDHALDGKQADEPFSSKPGSNRPGCGWVDADVAGLRFAGRFRQRMKDSPVSWYPLPLSIGAAVLVVVSFYKQVAMGHDAQRDVAATAEHVKVEGPWPVHVAAALPLRALSRAWGTFNSTELPVWFRSPGYRLYSWVFGVSLDEVERPLEDYRSMSEFFMRRLKPGARPIAEADLVSPADGKLVNLGYVSADGRISHIKGGEYSLEALLNGTGPLADGAPDNAAAHAASPKAGDGSGYRHHPHDSPLAEVDPHAFGQMLRNDAGPARQQGQTEDAGLHASRTPLGLSRSLSHDAAVALDAGVVGTGGGAGATLGAGHKLAFAVVYLAPGDYHRFHSPANWVVEKRRHFAGELYSVSPWMVSKLADLFVLNERVALLGRWKHGFFGMVPVGATNVGSIRVNFDAALRTNSPLRPLHPGHYSEATYATASAVLGGQPLRAGDEVGGFWLGSTIVLVMEVPDKWEFAQQPGAVVKVGEKLGGVAN